MERRFYEFFICPSPFSHQVKLKSDKKNCANQSDFLLSDHWATRFRTRLNHIFISIHIIHINEVIQYLWLNSHLPKCQVSSRDFAVYQSSRELEELASHIPAFNAQNVNITASNEFLRILFVLCCLLNLVSCCLSPLCYWYIEQLLCSLLCTVAQ